MNSKDFLAKVHEKPEVKSKYNFIGPFLEYARVTLSTGCNCKKKQKEKLIEDRFQMLQKTAPTEAWLEMKNFLNGS